MADKFEELRGIQRSRLTAVGNKANVLSGYASGMRDSAKKARELLEKAKGGDPDATVGDKEWDYVLKMQKYIPNILGEIDDDIAAILKARSALDQAAKAAKKT